MNTIRFETDLVRYSILEDGRVEGFYDKRTGENLLIGDAPQYFAVLYNQEAFKEDLTKSGPGIPGEIISTGALPVLPRKLTFENGLLNICFEGYTAEFRVTVASNHIIFELLNEIPKHFHSMSISRIYLREFGSDDNDLCAVTHAMKINFQPHFYCSALEHILGGEVFSQIGTSCAKFAVITASRSTLMQNLRDFSSHIDPNEMIYSPCGGAFASLEQHNLSYTIVLDIDDLEADAAKYKKYGVGQIDFHQSGAFRQGDMQFSAKYHHDIQYFYREVSLPLQKKGFTLSLHTYSHLLSPTDDRTLSNPAFQQDIAVLEELTLAADVTANADSIALLETDQFIAASDLFRSKDSPYLLIDQEIVKFESGQGILKTIRGCCGTQAACHQAGTKVKHLEQYYNLLDPVPCSPLFNAIAKYTAQACNDGGFDMVYLDAFDALHIQSPEYAWYYSAAFLLEILKHLEKPVAFEYSTMTPLLWHARSRIGAWDVPRRGYKYFVQYHQQCNQRQAPSHDLPQTLGWFHFYPPVSPEIWPGKENRILHSDDVDFVGINALAWDSSTAYQYADSPVCFPKYLENMDRYSQYEHLRLQKYFDDSILAQIRQGGEYCLENSDGYYQLRRKHYEKNKLCPAYGLATLAAENPFHPQKPFLRIEGLYSVGNQEVPLSCTLGKDHDTVCFGPTLNLKNTPCVKFRVTGNLSDDVILIQLHTGLERSFTAANYLIKCDFEGQRDFLFAESCNGEMDDALFDGKQTAVFSEYLKQTDYGVTDQFRLYCHGSCEGVSVDEIVMMDCRNIPLVNPKVQIGGQTLAFDCTLSAAEYIEYQDGKAMLYDIYGHGKEVGVSGSLPELSGRFTAEITADNQEPYRAEVTFGFTGDILK